jgi:membrane-associated phospholipid phosphatase
MRYTTAMSSVLLLAAAMMSGCAGRTDPGWGGRWPTASDLGAAVVGTARDPRTWVPLAGAATLAVTGLDDDLADWASDHRPLFGADAASDSDDLRTAATAAWLITALAAPSAGPAQKAGGLLAGAGALAVEDLLTQGIKDAAGRERPDGSDDQSFSSGHAARAAAATTLALGNLDHQPLPGWADLSLRVALHGVAAGTAWARVEADKHYPTDVLAGYALGRFVAGVAQRAFVTGPGDGAFAWRFEPLPRGGAVTLTYLPGAP